MRILLISANREVFPDPVFPLGAAIVASAARLAGHDVRVLDLMGLSRPGRTLAARLRSDNPDVVAISLRNLDNAAYPLARSYLPEYRLLVSEIRKNVLPGVPIIAGGSAFSLMPELLLDELGVDFGISGEGEESFPLLLSALSGNRSPETIPGAVFRPAAGCVPVSAPPALSRRQSPYSLAGLPLADRESFGARRYHRLGGAANLQTKRGCVFRCQYCTYPLLEGPTFRLRPPEEVAGEVENLVHNYGIRSLFIVDSIFNSPPEHAEAVCRKLIERNLPIRWSCYATPAGMTRSLLALMQKAGCDGIELGTDSGENGMLTGMGKGFSVAQMLQVGRWCRELDLGLCHSLIFGGPGETIGSVRETCRVVEETRPTAVVAMAGVRIYPGTPLAEIAQAKGMIDSPKSYLEPLFYVEQGVREILPGELIGFARNHGHWILPGLVPPMRPVTQKLFRMAGFRRPLWHLLRYAPLRERIYRDR